MGLPAERKECSVGEYLALERGSEDRYEYVDGEIYLMAGESVEHADISSNLLSEFHGQLKGTPCRAWTKDMKVRSGPLPTARTTTKGLYSHPDIVIVCGEPQFLDEHKDVLLNPKVILEVLSPSTESFDRGGKFWRYRTWNETLTDYVVVAQDGVFVEHFTRGLEGTWSIAATYTELDQALDLPCIRARVPLSDIYDRVYSNS